MEDIFEGVYLNNYRFEKYLRGDSHCGVFQGVHLKTAKKVAIKVFFLKEKHPKFKDFLSQQLETYRLIKNPNVLRIEEYFESEDHGFLVYEFCKSKTLEDYWIKHKKLILEKKLIKIIRQIFNGFKALCDKKLFNRDYRLKNILVSENKVKVGDSLDIVSTNSLFFQNQREYMAPEVLEEGDVRKNCAEADLWSIGVAVYKLIYGKAPFQGVNDLLLIKDIKRRIFDEGKNQSSDSLPTAKKGIEFPREGLKFPGLFESLLRKIFRPAASRIISDVFSEDLLLRRFDEKDFEGESELILSLKSTNEANKEVGSTNWFSLAKSLPLQNLGLNSTNHPHPNSMKHSAEDDSEIEKKSPLLGNQVKSFPPCVNQNLNNNEKNEQVKKQNVEEVLQKLESEEETKLTQRESSTLGYPNNSLICEKKQKNIIASCKNKNSKEGEKSFQKSIGGQFCLGFLSKK